MVDLWLSNKPKAVSDGVSYSDLLEILIRNFAGNSFTIV